MIKLKRNMNSFDRVTRFIVASLLLTLFFVGGVRGIFGILILITSALFLFASFTAFCPFYKSTNLSTYKYSDDFLDR